MKRDLVLCDECPNYIIPGEEVYFIPNYPLIHFSVYTYQVICENMLYSKWTIIYANNVKKMMKHRMLISIVPHKEGRNTLHKSHVLWVTFTWYITSQY